MSCQIKFSCGKIELERQFNLMMDNLPKDLANFQGPHVIENWTACSISYLSTFILVGLIKNICQFIFI